MTKYASPEKKKEYEVIRDLIEPHNGKLTSTQIISLLWDNHRVMIDKSMLNHICAVLDYKIKRIPRRKTIRPKKHYGTCYYKLTDLSWHLLKNQWNKELSYATA